MWKDMEEIIEYAERTVELVSEIAYNMRLYDEYGHGQGPKIVNQESHPVWEWLSSQGMKVLLKNGKCLMHDTKKLKDWVVKSYMLHLEVSKTYVPPIQYVSKIIPTKGICQSYLETLKIIHDDYSSYTTYAEFYNKLMYAFRGRFGWFDENMIWRTVENLPFDVAKNSCLDVSLLAYGYEGRQFSFRFSPLYGALSYRWRSLMDYLDMEYDERKVINSLTLLRDGDTVDMFIRFMNEGPADGKRFPTRAEMKYITDWDMSYDSDIKEVFSPYLTFNIHRNPKLIKLLVSEIKENSKIGSKEMIQFLEDRYREKILDRDSKDRKKYGDMTYLKKFVSIGSKDIRFMREPENGNESTFDWVEVHVSLTHKVANRDWVNEHLKDIYLLVIHTLKRKSRWNQFGLPTNVLQFTKVTLMHDCILDIRLDMKDMH